jgi:cystathionine beta-lyase/cystathionine gamma-synthase
VSEPLDRSTIWPYDERGELRDFYYQRFGSPTVAAAEAALGELDGGTALLFPSGAGATTALALSLLSPGDTVALAGGGYYGTGVTFAALEPWGIRVVEFDQTGPPPEEPGSCGSKRPRTRTSPCRTSRRPPPIPRRSWSMQRSQRRFT